MLVPALRRQALGPSRSIRIALPSLSRWYASFPPHTVVKMPALSPTMTAGNIGAWQKKPGDSVVPGDVLVEIETDKAQMDFEYQEEGVLAKILKETGEKDVAVGNPIAVLVEEGTDVSAFESFSLADAGGEAAAAPAPKKETSKPASSEPLPTPAASSESKTSDAGLDTSDVGGKLETALDRAPNVTLAARRLAQKNGINLGHVKGSGPGGKILEQDITKAAAGSSASVPGAAYEDIPISNMRKTIANRLKESVAENPHYFISSSLSVSKLLKLRQALNSTADGKYRLSVNDFMIKAASIACLKVPAVNCAWMGDSIRQYKTVDVSVAVSTPNGLITPIVKGVESMGLENISHVVKTLAKKARDNKLTPEQYQGGTISISNMGMYTAVERFTAIINPPQAAIIAVGAAKKVAVPAEKDDGTTGVEWDDQIVVTASFDHKVVDGAVGASWMHEFKKVIENPLDMLL